MSKKRSYSALNDSVPCTSRVVTTPIMLGKDLFGQNVQGNAEALVVASRDSEGSNPDVRFGVVAEVTWICKRVCIMLVTCWEMSEFLSERLVYLFKTLLQKLFIA